MAGQGRAQGRVGGRVGTWPGVAGAAPWRLPHAGVTGPLAEKLSTRAAAKLAPGRLMPWLRDYLLECRQDGPLSRVASPPPRVPTWPPTSVRQGQKAGRVGYRRARTSITTQQDTRSVWLTPLHLLCSHQ